MLDITGLETSKGFLYFQELKIFIFLTHLFFMHYLDMKERDDGAVGSERWSRILFHLDKCLRGLNILA